MSPDSQADGKPNSRSRWAELTTVTRRPSPPLRPKSDACNADQSTHGHPNEPGFGRKGSGEQAGLAARTYYASPERTPRESSQGASTAWPGNKGNGGNAWRLVFLRCPLSLPLRRRDAGQGRQ